MSYRDVFNQIMFYGEFDHMPSVHWAAWEETWERWRAEGLPKDVNIHEYLGTTPHWGGIGVNVGLYPAFEEEVIEDTDEYRVFRDGEGVVCQDWKHQSCIPHYIDFTLKEAKNWPEYKKRLQPDPARLGTDLEKRIADAEKSELPISFNTASLMGWIRNWMGVENMSYLMFDDRDCYADMVDTISTLVCWAIDQVFPKMKVKPEMGFGWEDICGKAGPLVSPVIFDQCVAPGYRKIRQKLEDYGVKLYGIDSDGDVTDLVGHWLDAGVNMQFPIEVGVWKGDAMKFRKQYGKDLRIIGNFDKLALERGRADVESEIERLTPLMKDGGFLMMPDHLITPGVALEDYRWYCKRVKEIRL